MVFDLLTLGEKDSGPDPLKGRRKALEKLVKGANLGRARSTPEPQRLGGVD